MTNKYKPHVLVLPEDDANRQLANGFMMHAGVPIRSVQILPPAGGWAAVRDSFLREHNAAMKAFPQRAMVLLVDFDGRGDDRLQAVLSGVDPEIADRVFVLGAHGEPEALRSALRQGYEAIGKKLAEECLSGTNELWMHELLAHNVGELVRMNMHVNPRLCP